MQLRVPAVSELIAAQILLWLCVAFTNGVATARDLTVVAPKLACESLTNRSFDADGNPARVTSAKPETIAGAAHCVIQGYVAPQVRFELRLPQNAWRQRLLFAGCGGFCGQVNLRVVAAVGCRATDNGEMALVTSDLGHNAGGTDGIWAVNNPQGIRDWGHRGVHVTTAAARAIVQAYYGQAPRYSYFSGCSDGGREGLMTAQRYPQDFDGIVAGAPVNNVSANNSILHAWIAQQLLNKDGTPRVREEQLTALHAHILRQCDARDGMADGILAQPDNCQPKLDRLVCRARAPETCLTTEQLAAVRAVYSGPVDAAGKALYFGAALGSERGWLGQARGSVLFATNFISYMTGPPYAGEIDVWQVGYTPTHLVRYNHHADEINALDANLAPFAARGGKLLLWHGWTDPGVPPGSTVDYFRRLQSTLGSTNAAAFSRLYMLPGVNHCAGGDGPDRFDLLTQVMAWVEDGVAPGAISAFNANAPAKLWSIAPFPAPPTAPMF
jgi:feruloyl esterase